ncbi:hypothetical protein PLICBS_000072 [Purpureocillium lilacinum]|uniref:uncharacterized protein n=1 Tax=Purpureocillium lilacinum TaxID=33203 RepID=UPI00208022EA|nr:hypothetical protein PLICBS_000072 [Purpureocillium lilacinum]
MGSRKTLRDVYGPGTFVDLEYTPLVAECKRLLEYFARVSPGFTPDQAELDAVDFHGHELPIIPGPLKAQAMSAVYHAMIGIVGKEICAMKGVETGKISIDVDKSGLYPATPALVFIEGKGIAEIQKDRTLFKVGKDLDKGVLNKNSMHFRSWAIYPTKDPQIWYQVMGNLDPPGFLTAYGLDPNAAASSRDEAYALIRTEMSKYSAAELEQKNMEHESGKQELRELIEEADVIIQAFRLRSLERKGFGLEDILNMANKRRKGIVYVDLNCYGPDGYYAERPGFQQIADAASGCSYVCGKAYGFEEGTAVLPSLPIADMLSGAVGVIGTMLALRSRAQQGGSYHATVALTAIDAVQLEEEVGLYSPEIVQKIQDAYQFGKMTPDLHVEELLYVLGDAWGKRSDVLSRDGYMVNFSKTAWGKDHSILSPIVQYENGAATPRWSHGPVPYCSEENTVWT